jgi:hypothetical protein
MKELAELIIKPGCEAWSEYCTGCAKLATREMGFPPCREFNSPLASNGNSKNPLWYRCQACKDSEIKEHPYIGSKELDKQREEFLAYDFGNEGMTPDRIKDIDNYVDEFMGEESEYQIIAFEAKPLDNPMPTQEVQNEVRRICDGIRQLPSTDFKVIGPYVKKGAPVEVFYCKAEGWKNASFVMIDGEYFHARRKGEPHTFKRWSSCRILQDQDPIEWAKKWFDWDRWEADQ